MIAYEIGIQIAKTLDEWDLDLSVVDALVYAEKEGWKFDDIDKEEFKDAVREYIRRNR